jgi:hypothetical protein
MTSPVRTSGDWQLASFVAAYVLVFHHSAIRRPLSHVRVSTAPPFDWVLQATQPAREFMPHRALMGPGAALELNSIVVFFYTASSFHI